MKSKEEIEQLAKSKFSTNKNISLSQSNKTICRRSAFIKGYTLCQEDMADEIKELKMICNEYSKDVKKLNEIINSLNKQD